MIPIKDDNPTDLFPAVTVILIFINTMVFIYQMTIGMEAQQFVMEFGLIPYELTHFKNLPNSELIPPILSMFTSMFLHGGLLHLIGNMLYLWIFGNNIEDELGHGKFILFYLISGVAATMLHTVTGVNSQIPSIGASGAIAGVLGAYLILYPKARILTIIPIFYFIRIIKLPAILVLGFWFIIQLFRGFSGLAGSGSGGVAWFAHIGGFIAGIILIKLLPNRKDKENFSTTIP